MADSGLLNRRDFMVGGLAGITALSLNSETSGSSSQLTKLRYLIVGSGSRARNGHLPILTGYLPEVEIVGLCDITPENLSRGLEICGPATKGYADYGDMLSKHKEADAVVIVVPNYLHYQMTMQALEAGKHVLVEKPMATRLADIDRMIEASRQRKLTLQVGLEMRYTTAHRRMEELVRGDSIGDVEYVFASLFRGDWNPKSWKYKNPATGVLTNWRYLEFCTGGSLMEDGIHDLDVIHWLVGKAPVRIQATGGNSVYRTRETIDHAGLLIEFAGGASCAYSFTLYTPKVPDMRILRVFGSRGEMVIEKDEAGQSILIHKYNGQIERIPVPFVKPEESFWKGRREGDSGIETYRLHKAFAESISLGKRPLTDGKVGRDSAHISLAAEHSLRVGRPLQWSDEQGL